MMGSFHLHLNASEDHIRFAMPLYSRLHEEVFGVKLANNHSPSKVALLITALFSGWTALCDRILPKFNLCKDIEYVFMHHQMEEVLPLVALHYPVTFLGTNTNLYRELKEPGPNMATLASLADETHEFKFPPLRDIYQQYLPLITEKKVKLFHGGLRRQIQPHSTAEQIQQMARANSVGNLHQFEDAFLQGAPWEHPSHDLTVIKGKVIEWLLATMTTKVASNIGHSKKVIINTSCRTIKRELEHLVEVRPTQSIRTAFEIIDYYKCEISQ